MTDEKRNAFYGTAIKSVALFGIPLAVVGGSAIQASNPEEFAKLVTAVGLPTGICIVCVWAGVSYILNQTTQSNARELETQQQTNAREVKMREEQSELSRRLSDIECDFRTELVALVREQAAATREQANSTREQAVATTELRRAMEDQHRTLLQVLGKQT